MPRRPLGGIPAFFHGHFEFWRCPIEIKLCWDLWFFSQEIFVRFQCVHVWSKLCERNIWNQRGWKQNYLRKVSKVSWLITRWNSKLFDTSFPPSSPRNWKVNLEKKSSLAESSCPCWVVLLEFLSKLPKRSDHNWPQESPHAQATRHLFTRSGENQKDIEKTVFFRNIWVPFSLFLEGNHVGNLLPSSHLSQEMAGSIMEFLEEQEKETSPKIQGEFFREASHHEVFSGLGDGWGGSLPVIFEGLDGLETSKLCVNKRGWFQRET